MSKIINIQDETAIVVDKIVAIQFEENKLGKSNWVWYLRIWTVGEVMPFVFEYSNRDSRVADYTKVINAIENN